MGGFTGDAVRGEHLPPLACPTASHKQLIKVNLLKCESCLGWKFVCWGSGAWGISEQLEVDC